MELILKSVNAGYTKANVLHDISFNLFSSEKLAILGENGCGKTTLIKTIAGLLNYSGEIFLNGQNVKNEKRKYLARKIGVLNQSSSIYFSYSVYDTVMLGRYAHATKGLFYKETANDKFCVENCLKLLNLWDLKDRQIDTLSGGQLQRVYLARLLVQDPDLILLDEPTNHLDLKSQIELVAFLKKLSCQENKIIIGVFHDINLALDFADTILFLKKGKVIFFGKKDMLSSQVFKDAYGIDAVAWIKNSFKNWQKL